MADHIIFLHFFLTAIYLFYGISYPNKYVYYKHVFLMYRSKKKKTNYKFLNGSKTKKN